MSKETVTDARPSKFIYGQGCFLCIGESMKDHCDYHGKCKRKAYVEVYPGNGSWSYLCFWHFIWARMTRYKIKIKVKIIKRRLGWCKVDEEEM